MRARVAANVRAGVRLGELAAKYGTDTLLAIMQEVLDYSETMMRAALRALPDNERPRAQKWYAHATAFVKD